MISCLEFESIERNPNDEACFVEEGSPGDPTQAEECDGKLLDSAIRNHEAGNEPTVLFGSDTIPFVSDGLEGKLLDHYLLKDRIGSGGMARVYLANDTLLQRNVAIKVIQNREYVTDDEQMANSLMVEAVAQAQLNHPNIVSVFYVGKTDRMPFFGDGARRRTVAGAAISRWANSGLRGSRLLFSNHRRRCSMPSPMM